MIADFTNQSPLACRLASHSKGDVIQLLSQQLLHSKELEQQVQSLKSQIQQLETQKEHMLDMIEEFERIHETGNSVQGDWQRKYMKLSAYVNQSVKQAADLAAEYNHNLLLIRQEKKRIEHANSTLCQELGKLKGENQFLTQQFSKSQICLSELQLRLNGEYSARIQLQQELETMREKYDQVKRLTRQIIGRYGIVEQRCITLQNERGKLAQIGKQYKRKMQELQKSVSRDIMAVKNEATQELIAERHKTEHKEELSRFSIQLRQKSFQNNILKCANKQLSDELANQSHKSKQYEIRCNEIVMQINKFWRKNNKQSGSSFNEESQCHQNDIVSSQKTLTTSASGNVRGQCFRNKN